MNIINSVACEKRRNLRGVAQSGSAPALGAGRRGFKSLHPDHSRPEKGVRCGPVVKWPKTPPFHGGNSGSNPGRVILFSSIRRSGFSGGSPRAFSSVGQSSRLITDRSGVQVPEGPPLWPGSSVGLECQPVTLEVEGSSPFRVAISLPFG